VAIVSWSSILRGFAGWRNLEGFGGLRPHNARKSDLTSLFESRSGVDLRWTSDLIPTWLLTEYSGEENEFDVP
jgi:hypothetical protein